MLMPRRSVSASAAMPCTVSGPAHVLSLVNPGLTAAFGAELQGRGDLRTVFPAVGDFGLANKSPRPSPLAIMKRLRLVPAGCALTTRYDDSTDIRFLLCRLNRTPIAVPLSNRLETELSTRVDFW